MAQKGSIWLNIGNPDEVVNDGDPNEIIKTSEL